MEASVPQITEGARVQGVLGHWGTVETVLPGGGRCIIVMWDIGRTSREAVSDLRPTTNAGMEG
jgi:hypothetical protein